MHISPQPFCILVIGSLCTHQCGGRARGRATFIYSTYTSWEVNTKAMGIGIITALYPPHPKKGEFWNCSCVIIKALPAMNQECCNSHIEGETRHLKVPYIIYPGSLRREGGKRRETCIRTPWTDLLVNCQILTNQHVLEVKLKQKQKYNNSHVNWRALVACEWIRSAIFLPGSARNNSC